ncbi:TspO/MBR related protein [Pseudorhodoferax soli]|jgi:translocator protein|uniref:TspO/MBR related protein n=2 Tax=Pseudorhodoferax soli TaxID=545864 RepID=A0A368XCA8_9BURK|nr:TspO/MBR related protein [Pseudorhodoferax soli]
MPAMNASSPSAAPAARHWLGLLGWLLLCFAVAALGAWASRAAPQFYAQLDQPGWAPPASVFGPVWTLLYLMMAVAAWQVWRLRGWCVPLVLFLVQLAANGLWSWLFFGWRLGGPAFADIVLLWVLLAATLAGFWRIRRSAGLLLLPYLAWVTFAAALNWAVWQRNPGLL